MTIHVEILKVIFTKKTGILIEIDQVASCVTTLSYFIWNKVMVKQCDAIGIEPNDPYDFCIRKFASFYERLKKKDVAVESFFYSDRKVHKYALMCFCYSQTHMGKNMDF